MTAVVQRWRAGRDAYRPVGETINPAHFEVAPISSDSAAKRFVVKHHYSGSYPAARRRFGLYRRGELAGVAVFSVPARASVLTSCLPGESGDSAELGRFVLLDDVPANGETWFLARAFDQLRAEGFVGVVAYADPSKRRSHSGDLVFGGHVGTIYQAFNGVYVGQAPRRTIRLFEDGSVMSARAISKIRASERGWRYAAELLIKRGAPEPGPDLRAWGSKWVARLTRTFRHPGNHKYAWALRRRDRKHLPATQPFPKVSPCQ